MARIAVQNSPYIGLAENRSPQTLFWGQPKLGCHLLQIPDTPDLRMLRSIGTHGWKEDLYDTHLPFSNHPTLIRNPTGNAINSLTDFVVLKSYSTSSSFPGGCFDPVVEYAEFLFTFIVEHMVRLDSVLLGLRDYSVVLLGAESQFFYEACMDLEHKPYSRRNLHLIESLTHK